MRFLRPCLASLQPSAIVAALDSVKRVGVPLPRHGERPARKVSLKMSVICVYSLAVVQESAVAQADDTVAALGDARIVSGDKKGESMLVSYLKK